MQRCGCGGAPICQCEAHKSHPRDLESGITSKFPLLKRVKLTICYLDLFHIVWIENIMYCHNEDKYFIFNKFLYHIWFVAKTASVTFLWLSTLICGWNRNEVKIREASSKNNFCCVLPISKWKRNRQCFCQDKDCDIKRGIKCKWFIFTSFYLLCLPGQPLSR